MSAEPSRNTARWLSLALLSVVLAEMIRVAFPLLYDVRETDGATMAVLWALIAFVAAPMIAPVVGRLVGPGRALRFTVAALAAARVAAQVSHPIMLWVAIVGVGAGLMAVALLLHTARAAGEGGGATTAILAGLGADQAIRGAFSTWDAVWQTGAVATVVGIGLPVLLLGVLVAIPEEPGADEPTPRGVLGLAVVGPFLLLHLLFWGNAPFVASELAWRLPAAVGWVLVVAAASVWAAGWAASASAGRGARLGLGAAFVAGTAAMALAGGWLVAVGVLVGATAGGALLTMALAADPGDARDGLGHVRTAAALALGLAVFVGFAFAYQIDVNVPLPVPRATFPLAAALIVAAAALRRPVRERAVARWPVLVPVAGLAIVPLALLLTGARPDPVTGGGEAVIVDWNIHTAVDADGQIDLEGVAALIDAQDPDVVVLQEVGRGWPIAGSIDQLEWLSRRLDMPYAWAKAGDDQFGNAVLSRLPIGDVEILGLPYGEGPQWRSALRVEVEISPGEILPVIGVHLQNDESRAATRTAQIEALLDTWDGTAVMTGDFNMQPTETENVSMIEDAGYVSLQDTLGDPGASTARDPLFDGDRVDWMWVRGVVDATSFAILRSEASDHLPLVATVELGTDAVP